MGGGWEVLILILIIVLGRDSERAITQMMRIAMANGVHNG